MQACVGSVFRIWYSGSYQDSSLALFRILARMHEKISSRLYLPLAQDQSKICISKNHNRISISKLNKVSTKWMISQDLLRFYSGRDEILKIDRNLLWFLFRSWFKSMQKQIKRLCQIFLKFLRNLFRIYILHWNLCDIHDIKLIICPILCWIILGRLVN